MVAYVIAPGIGGSDEQHWQSVWERQWVGRAVRTAPSSWDAPQLADWVCALEDAVTAAEAIDADVVIVAHSLGCWATAMWAARHPGRNVRGILLVAPPDQHSAAFPTEAAATFMPLTAAPLPYAAAVIASTNDPYCTPEVAATFAREWNATLHSVGAKGHINAASNLGPWEQGAKILRSLEH